MATAHSPPPSGSAGLPLPPSPYLQDSSVYSVRRKLQVCRTKLAPTTRANLLFAAATALLCALLVWSAVSFRRRESFVDFKKWESSKYLRLPEIYIGQAPSSGALTCGRDVDDEEEAAVIRGMRRFLTTKRRGKRKHITLILASSGVLDSLTYLIQSARDNAPELFATIMILCVGQETLTSCEDKWGNTMRVTCVLDDSLSRFVSAEAKEDGLSTGQRVNDAYLNLIWRKPELLYLAQLAGADTALVVDTDGLLLRDFTEEEWTDDAVARSSTEFLFTSSFFLSPDKCLGVQSARGAPLLLNSGTVLFNFRRLESKELLESWMKKRALAGNNAGRCEPTNERSNISFLDQDGWNQAACETSEQVKTFIPNQVMLNSFHHQARSTDGYDLCKVFYFHATNCGKTQDKTLCLERNLQRWREAGCDKKAKTPSL